MLYQYIFCLGESVGDADDLFLVVLRPRPRDASEEAGLRPRRSVGVRTAFHGNERRRATKKTLLGERCDPPRVAELVEEIAMVLGPRDQGNSLINLVDVLGD